MFLLSRITHPRHFAVLCTASPASRLWIMAERIPADAPRLAPDGTRPGGAVTAALSPAGGRASVVATVLLMAAGALMVESRRASWLPAWQALYGPLYDRGGGRVFLVVVDDYSEQACLHLPLKGRRFRATVRTGPADAITDEDYAVWLRRATGEEPRLPGYDAVVRTEAGTLFARTR